MRTEDSVTVQCNSKSTYVVLSRHSNTAVRSMPPLETHQTPTHSYRVFCRAAIPMNELDEMFEQMFKQFERLLAASGAAIVNPQVAVHHATYLRNYYEALVDNGFAPTDALAIVTAHGLSGAKVSI